METELEDDPLHPSNLAPAVQAVLSDRCTAPFGTYLAFVEDGAICIHELWSDGGLADQWTLTVQQAAVLVARVASWSFVATCRDIDSAIGDTLNVGGRRAA